MSSEGPIGSLEGLARMDTRASSAWRFKGLAFRIGTLVFAASLITSLVVAWVSVHSVEDFLRGRIDRKFPELLQTTQTHLDLWYRQRELDIGVFARSPIVAEGLEITATVVCTGRTGVEMEALLAVSAAALTVYDMCKAVDGDMEIGKIRLVEKRKEPTA